MQKPGRNDPCPCGSGKKYKRCHLADDEARASAGRAAASKLAANDAAAPAPLPPANPQQIIGLLKTLASQGTATERADFTRLLEESRTTLDYMSRQPDIESASAILEPHRGEFLKLTQDPDALMKRAQALFAEPRFAPLRFTAADIQRAFDCVGQPAFGLVAADRTVKLLRAAILHLADKPRRSSMAMSLLIHLPDVVAEDRLLDGWIIQHTAFETTEVPDESNPFLFAMFSFGYDAWADEKNARNDAFAREIGFDPEQLRNMTPAELDACLARMQDDPATMARLETFLNANPGERAQTNATLDAIEKESVELLQRDDAAGPLLTPEEMEPWLPVLNERLLVLLEPLRQPDASLPPDPALGQRVMDELWPLLGEMAEGIFTPERIQQLIQRIKAFRDERHAGGDKQIIGQCLGATNQLEREASPAKNYFLKSLCFFSLRASGREAEAVGQLT